MEPALLLGYWGVALLLIAIPGPDWAFILAAGSRERMLLASVLGLMVGYAITTVIVAVGLGAVVAASPVLLTWFTIAGAAYFIYLGVTLALRPAAVPDATDGTRPGSRWLPFAHGIGISALNPKALLIFLAIMPQFAGTAQPWPLPLQLGMLGAIWIVTGGLFYLALGGASRTIARTRPGVARVITRLAGLAMALLGVGLLVERVLALA